MKKILLIFLLAVLLLSCISKKMNSWIGQPKQSLIMKWGPPAQTTSDGGTGEILVYANQVYIPQYRLNFYDYRMFYCDNNGKIYSWLTKREQIPPTQIDLRVYRKY